MSLSSTNVELMKEMELVGVRIELPSNAPIVLLRETDGEGRLLPIFIGGAEAQAIALAMEEVETPRPMTHDLFKNVLDDLGVRIERIVVTELRDRTFLCRTGVGRRKRGPADFKPPLRCGRPGRSHRGPYLRRRSGTGGRRACSGA